MHNEVVLGLHIFYQTLSSSSINLVKLFVLPGASKVVAQNSKKYLNDESATYTQ